MKKMQYVVMLCLPFLAQAQTAQVHIAGSDYPVKFTDTNLVATVKQRIATDLTIIFSLSPPFEELKAKETDQGIFRLADETQFFWDESEHIFLVDKDNKKSIRVDKPLSDKYLKAFTWIDANSNTVKKAHEFVAILNSPDLLSKPPQVLLGLCHVEPLSDIEKNNPPSDTEIQAIFAKDFFPLTYLTISAQNFYFKEIPEIGGKEIPLLLIFAVGKSDPMKNSIHFAGFYKGKWGFGRFPAPFNVP